MYLKKISLFIVLVLVATFTHIVGVNAELSNPTIFEYQYKSISGTDNTNIKISRYLYMGDKRDYIGSTECKLVDGDSNYSVNLGHPKYLVQYSDTDSLTYYTYDSLDHIDTSKTVVKKYEYYDGPEPLGGFNKDCKYTPYTFDGTQWVAGSETTVNITGTEDNSSATSKMNNVEFHFTDLWAGSQGGLGEEGNINASNMLPDSCPTYLVPTFNLFGGKFVDAYNEETDISTITEKGQRFEKKYYKRTDAQKEEDQENIFYVDCTYYRASTNNTKSKVLLHIYRAFSSTTMDQSYGIDGTYYESLDTEVGKKFDVLNINEEAINEMLQNASATQQGECLFPYAYVKTDPKKQDRIEMDLLSGKEDPSIAYKYYSLAKTNEDAQKYINEMYQARYLIRDIVAAVKMNPEMTIRKAAVEKALRDAIERISTKGLSTTQVDNVLSYLQNGGKVDKAIYDYANYWYATATTYSRAYVIGESCDPSCNSAGYSEGTCSFCLHEHAEDLKTYIETNITSGYIPLPDGCQMLSNDLVEFLAWVLRVIRYAAVVIAILLGMADFFRAISENDEKALKKAGGRFLKRIMAVVFIFLAAIFIQFILYNYTLPGIGPEEIDLCGIAQK